MPHPRRPLAHLSLVTAALLLVALLCAGCGGATAKLTADTGTGTATVPATPGTTTGAAAATITGPTETTAASSTAQIRAGGDQPSVAPTSTSQGFLGISTEQSKITNLSGTPTNQDTPFVHMLKALSVGAPFLLRLGGDSADFSWFAIPGQRKPSGIRYTLTPQWTTDVKSLLTAIGGKALLGVDLELDKSQVTAYEAQQFEKLIGPKLIDAFELGNEPELYAAFNYFTLPDGKEIPGRTPGDYTIADYGRDFTNIAKGLGNDPIAGPASGSPTWLPDLNEMLDDLPNRLSLVTVHQYPEKRCVSSTTVPESGFFTNASIQGLANFVHGLVRVAGAHHKPLRVDEINGISCGGQPGVSDSFGEALWALNMLPALWQAGVQGANWQTNAGNGNQIFGARDTRAGWNVSIIPEYYGLLAFADVAPAGSRLLSINNPGYGGFYQYAVANPDGARRVVLTNVSGGSRTVGVSVSGARGTGVITGLNASSLGASTGTTLGGQSVSSSTGELTGRQAYTLIKPNRKGVYAVRVPAHSAEILTVGT